MERIITVITDKGISTKIGPDANQALQNVRWATKKVAAAERKSTGWMARAIRATALNEARRSISERELRRLQWGV